MTWDQYVDTTDRVNMSRATADILRLTVYAYEPYEDRFFYDIEALNPSGVVLPLDIKKGFPHYATVADARRACALKAKSYGSNIVKAIGVVK